jgi:hypothetical protein
MRQAYERFCTDYSAPGFHLDAVDFLFRNLAHLAEHIREAIDAEKDAGTLEYIAGLHAEHPVNKRRISFSKCASVHSWRVLNYL